MLHFIRWSLYGSQFNNKTMRTDEVFGMKPFFLSIKFCSIEFLFHLSVLWWKCGLNEISEIHMK